MPPKGHAELAHPQAADWVLGPSGPTRSSVFQLHLRGCPHCQVAMAEFGQLGQLLRHLPPAAEPPPALEARTIASILGRGRRTGAPRQQQRADRPSPAAGGMAKVIRFPRWRGRTGLLTIASAVAAAVISAVLSSARPRRPEGALRLPLAPPADRTGGFRGVRFGDGPRRIPPVAGTSP